MVIIASVSVLLAGCQEAAKLFSSVQKPTIKMTGLSIQDVSLDSASLVFEVEVENPYSVSLPLTDINYSVTANGAKFMSGAADLQQLIPAKSTKIVSLPATVNYVEALGAVKGITPGSTVPYQADIALSATTPVLGDITIPVSKQGQLDLPSIDKAALTTILNKLISQ